MYFVKHYRVIVIGSVLIIFSIIVAEINTIIKLDTKQCILTLVILMLVSLSVSLKKYNVIPALIAFSKSSWSNKTIHWLFFISRSIINNIPLLLFNLIVLKGIITVEYFIYIPVATFFSILCSFFLMSIKNKYANKKTSREKVNKIRINPLVKSTVYDYFTFEFLQTAVIVVFLFVVILFEFIKERNIFQKFDNFLVVLMGLTVVLSLGFMGIIDSIPHTNWKYYAIIAPYNFMCHFRKTALFLTGVFGFFIAVFIVAVSFFSVTAMFKYLYCMIILIFLTVSISFTTGSRFVKALVLTISLVLTMWISSLHVYFLPILIIPALAALIKAKSEYMEWYLL
jgi:hypothetical protein